MISTSCIIVTYNPNPKKFIEVLNSIIKQCSQIHIIDNSDNDLSSFLPRAKHIEYLYLQKNIGIAAAQNIGIQKAINKGHDLIWLSDQDTIYPENYIKNMLPLFHQQIGKKISSVAPAYFDVNKNSVQDFIDHTPFTHRIKPRPGSNLISHAIASGMLIPAEVLKEVGLMQESLFIDWVDLEWCWRAMYRFGYQNIGNGDVVIQHTMGDNSITFLGRKISFRSPLRHYYMIRNAVHLALHSNSASVPIRVEIFFKALAWTVIFPMLATKQKSRHFNATFRGMVDGVRNKLGPMQS